MPKHDRVSKRRRGNRRVLVKKARMQPDRPASERVTYAEARTAWDHFFAAYTASDVTQDAHAAADFADAALSYRNDRFGEASR